MTSLKQIEANRRNSLKSTGPKTETGKQTSRCNAVRHGLTAELEDLNSPEDAANWAQRVLAAKNTLTAPHAERSSRLFRQGWRVLGLILQRISSCREKLGRSPRLWLRAESGGEPLV